MALQQTTCETISAEEKVLEPVMIIRNWCSAWRVEVSLDIRGPVRWARRLGKDKMLPGAWGSSHSWVGVPAKAIEPLPSLEILERRGHSRFVSAMVLASTA